MNLKNFENKARQSWWVVHIEPWRQSGLDRTNYCRQHGRWKCTFDRWLKYLAARKRRVSTRNIKWNCAVRNGLKSERSGGKGGLDCAMR